MVSLVVAGDQSGERLDKVLAASLNDVSRSLLQRLIDGGQVTVAGTPARSSYRVRSGDVIAVDLQMPPSLSADPEPIELPIVYEDEAIVVIDKPAGLVVHPAPGHPGGTLVNALTYRYPQVAAGGGLRPGLVHRLDKDTSGLMVAALTAGAQANLMAQIKRHAVKREYLALVAGHPLRKQYRIDAPIGRDSRSRARMAVGSDTIRPRPAQTHFWVQEYFESFSLLRLRLETGRTHQIRVHLAYAGFPVAGDRVYQGPALPGLWRQFLHATRLDFASPLTGEPMSFISPLPSDLGLVLEELPRRV